MLNVIKKWITGYNTIEAYHIDNEMNKLAQRSTIVHIVRSTWMWKM